MKKKINIDLFIWFVELLLNAKRKSYPLATLGTRIILASIPSSFLISYITLTFLPEEYDFFGFEFSNSDLSLASTVFGFLGFLIGIYMILKEVNMKARNTARVLITGLPGTSNDFPRDLLSRAEISRARELILLSTTERLNHLENQIVRYNSELNVDLFKRFVLQESCEKLYIGGLARLPFLVAYGAFLRNVTAEIVYFDKMHRNSKWELLNKPNDSVVFSKYDYCPTPNSSGEIGIAIGFSTVIDQSQLPDSIQENTLILRPEIVNGRNLVQNQENLQNISSNLVEIIDQMSALSNCKTIHLFLSVQSSLAIEIGRRFQEGIHKEWVIHNFDAPEGKYNWALKLSKDGIEEYNSN